MNSIKRITKRVKHTMLALVLDVRGEVSMASPAAMITIGAGVVGTGLAAQHALASTAANSNTAQSGAQALGGKLSTMTGGTPVTAATASSPAGN